MSEKKNEVTINADMIYMIGSLIIELGRYEMAKEEMIEQSAGKDIADSLSDSCACPWHMFGEKVSEWLSNAALEVVGADSLADALTSDASLGAALSDDLRAYIKERMERQVEAIAMDRINSLGDDATLN